MNRSSQSILLAASFASALFALPASAGDYGKSPIDKNVVADDPWADAIRPITNPTLFDLAIPQTQLHPVFMYNSMPSVVDTIIGGVPVGGDYQVYALQFEYALSDRLSLNATKAATSSSIPRALSPTTKVSPMSPSDRNTPGSSNRRKASPRTSSFSMKSPWATRGPGKERETGSSSLRSRP